MRKHETILGCDVSYTIEYHTLAHSPEFGRKWESPFDISNIEIGYEIPPQWVDELIGEYEESPETAIDKIHDAITAGIWDFELSLMEE